MSERAAGILMPISSLPSEYGIGCFSKSAYEFVDWLKKAGQSYWQILPLGPTSYGDSPYQSFSTFAGNPYFISLEALVEEGRVKYIGMSNMTVPKLQAVLPLCRIQPMFLGMELHPGFQHLLFFY